jgi:hypothetical protein
MPLRARSTASWECNHCRSIRPPDTGSSPEYRSLQEVGSCPQPRVAAARVREIPLLAWLPAPTPLADLMRAREMRVVQPP